MSKITIDFYTVEMPKGAPTFESVILKDAASPDDESRNDNIGGYPIRLQEAHSGAGIIEGDMLKIQMSDLPPKAKTNGKVSNLNLADDEGIGGETAFLYHPNTKVIVLQRNRGGVTAKRTVEYFTRKAALDSPITFRPIIQGDALKRLISMKETKKMRIYFANVSNPEFFRNHGKGLSEMIDVLEYFGAPKGVVEVSMGHEKGTLLGQRIVALGRSVLSLVGLGSDGANDVDKMEVTGVLDDDSRDVFDLLAYRMVELVTAEENKARRSNYKRRRPEIRQAFERRKKELVEMFGV